MRNALDEFVIEGINTTIPLYKTIMNDKYFISGELSTDYLDRYSMIQKMKDEQKALNSDLQKKLLPAVSSAILQSDFIKKNNTSENNTSNSWKFGGLNC
jgi:acetyl-CoA/propionyl-CoA carboxylase